MAYTKVSFKERGLNMMTQVYSDVIQYRGTHYEFGYFQGEMLKDSPILPNRKKQWGPRMKRHFIIDTSTFQKTIKAVAPLIWDEICGLADALNMSMGEAVQLFGGYYQRSEEHTSELQSRFDLVCRLLLEKK